jgi:putative Mg2+ transporter-C (MgtC) family protein
LPVLALAATGGHFAIVLSFPYIARRLPSSRWTPSLLQVRYHDGEAILRDVLVKCTQHNFTVSSLEVKREEPVGQTTEHIVMVALEIQGTGAVSKLVSKLADLEGVISVNAGDVNVLTD